MIIKRLENIKEFIANDNSRLKEIINPRKENLKLRYSLAYAQVQKNRKTLKHCLRYSEVYFILKGKGVMHIDAEKRIVKSGDTIYIPPGSVQFIENKGKRPLEFLCIVDPAWKPDCEKIL
ncbi:MAG: cupin domain-containing protein [bacterium]